MVYNYNYNPDDNTTLVYDLRQKYAEIVGSILEEVARARSEDKFIEWFKWLDDLHTEIDQKFTKQERVEYYKELDKTLKVLNNNRAAYLKTGTNEEQISNVKSALKGLNMWLKLLMEKHKMFGAKEEVEGLI